jgi:hypothetical protein
LTNKFARRFVMVAIVKIYQADGYVQGKARRIREAFRFETTHLKMGDLPMRKTILTILGSALLASSMIPAASAAEHHRRLAHRAATPISESTRAANASVAPQPGWEDYTGYYSHGFSAPAGR